MENPVLSEINKLANCSYRKGRVDYIELEAELNTPNNEFLRAIERNCNSVVLILDKKDIEPLGKNSKKVKINSQKLLERKFHNAKSICKSEAYVNQQSAKAIGTGFFIKKNINHYIIATAGHVILNNTCKYKDLRFVSGFIIKNENKFEDEIIVSKNQVFKPQNLELNHTQYYVSELSDDWALVGVEAAYQETISPASVQTVEVSKDLNIIKNQSVYSIGHGLHLPMKVSIDGKVIKSHKNKPIVECDLSLFGGNSGSPVFDARTHLLLGIYTKGLNPFEENQTGDWKIKQRSTLEYEGQEFQRLEPVLQALKNIPFAV